MIENVRRGADPELFLRDKDNMPIPSIGLIGGTKQSPRQLGNGFALQEDNVTVEFNIPPAASSKEFVAAIHFGLEFIKQELAPKGISLDISPTMEFTVQQLAHPQAQELGCEPDLNAWTRQVNPRPLAPETMRSSGGHLHLSWNNPKEIEKFNVIRAHDLFCGVPSIIYDDDVNRRQIYGKAGAMRSKTYGVEYRTLSNFWIKSEELTEWLYNQSEKAIAFINSGGRIAKEDALKIIKCINNTDQKLLAELNEKYALV